MSSTADPRPRPPQEDVAVGRRRRRRRPWLIALAVVLVALLAVRLLTRGDAGARALGRTADRLAGLAGRPRDSLAVVAGARSNHSGLAFRIG